MARQRTTGGGGCLAELVVVTLLVWPMQLLQPVCGWSDAETGGLEVAVCGLLATLAFEGVPPWGVRRRHVKRRQLGCDSRWLRALPATGA
jgi:hypothetical protein